MLKLIVERISGSGLHRLRRMLIAILTFCIEPRARAKS